ncbi:MAG TPA: hypothetical protein VFV81_07840, partial [Verrucomicrobiae bacterium]|nr:hypothetical protein [Verrucomicrobiae bacterium]
NAQISPQCWGSFNLSTNSPVSYPAPGYSNNLLTVHLRFLDSDFNPIPMPTNQTLQVAIPPGNIANLEISTNQVDWTILATTTNSGTVIDWYHYGSGTPAKFFRVVPGQN